MKSNRNVKLNVLLFLSCPEIPIPDEHDKISKQDGIWILVVLVIQPHSPGLGISGRNNSFASHILV